MPVSVVLKAFVIGSGVLLVAGTIVLAVLLVFRIGGGAQPEETTLVATTMPDEPVLLPPGATIQQVIPGDDRIVLLGVAGDGNPFLALIDPDHGRLIRLIRFASDTAP